MKKRRNDASAERSVTESPSVCGCCGGPLDAAAGRGGGHDAGHGADDPAGRQPGLGLRPEPAGPPRVQPCAPEEGAARAAAPPPAPGPPPPPHRAAAACAQCAPPPARVRRHLQPSLRAPARPNWVNHLNFLALDKCSSCTEAELLRNVYFILLRCQLNFARVFTILGEGPYCGHGLLLIESLL